MEEWRGTCAIYSLISDWSSWRYVGRTSHRTELRAGVARCRALPGPGIAGTVVSLYASLRYLDVGPAGGGHVGLGVEAGRAAGEAGRLGLTGVWHPVEVAGAGGAGGRGRVVSGQAKVVVQEVVTTYMLALPGHHLCTLVTS